MKKITAFLALAFITASSQAKIWRVNNDASKGANFTDLQTANNNASVLNGDTLHLEPSTNNYAGVSFTKALVIIGNGYFLTGTGSNAGLQQNTATSTINGSCSFSSTAAGASMMGVTVTSNVVLNNVSNINVTRCRLNSVEFQNYGNTAANGLRITKCFIINQVTTSGFTGTPSVDVTFENNIFSTVTGIGSNNIQFNLPTTVKGLFRNNIFNENASQLALSNFYVTNNIFTITSGNLALANANVNNVYKNNIFLGTSIGNGLVGGTNGNVVGVPFANVFATNPNTGSGDARFQILPNATNPAFNGGETIGAVTTPSCGAFGATDPYRLSGIPAVPTIYSLTLPSGIATGATSMQISVSTKSNN
jgi:hypothetical protein